ncbi:hypothetical protein IMG5_133130, partial [Ichthyophthirius multifiliis]
MRDFVFSVYYCLNGCSSCINAISCTNCIQGYYLDNSICVQNCPIGKYKNDINRNCTSQNVSCIQECPIGKFKNDSDRTCTLCNNSCSSCTSLNQCQSCNQGFYLDNSVCVQECSVGKFKNNSDRTCTSCDNSCSSCTSLNICQSCNQGFYLDNTICVQECPIGKFKNNLNNTCTLCDNSCTQCTSLSICQSCNQGFYLDNSVCVQECPIGKFKNNPDRTCTSCDNSCSSCTSLSICQSCNQGFYLENVSCIQECPIGNCSSCTSTTLCQSCNLNFFLDNSLCVSECPIGKFKNNSNRTCTSCDSKCENCTSLTLCQSCNLGFFFDNQSCLIDCQQGKYKNASNRQCSFCDNKCKSCDNGLTCNGCFGNRVGDQCDCPLYSIFSNDYQKQCFECKNVLIGCGQCTINECISCIPDLYFDFNQLKQCDSCQELNVQIIFSNDFELLFVNFDYFNLGVITNLILNNSNFQNDQQKSRFSYLLCSEVLNQQFITQKLSNDIACSFIQNKLTIRLSPQSIINKDDIIVIKENVFKITYKGVECTQFIQKIKGKIIYDQNPLSPIITINSPTLISKCDELFIQISQLQNIGKRIPKSINWISIASSESQQFINQLNAQLQQQQNNFILVIPSMTFKGSSFYQFEVQIETVFQQKQSVVININTKNDKFIDLQLENSKDIVFRYEEFKLKVIFYYLQCDPIEKLKKVNEKILLKIEQIINLQNNLNINFENQTMDNEHTINIQPYILVLDQQYDIKITVSDVNNSQIFQEIIHSFQVKKSQQIVKIQGLSNIQSFSNSFYVNAFIDNLDLSPSEKEVQKNNNYGIKTKWKCITAKSQSDCRDYKNDLIVDPNMEQNILQIKVQEKSLEAYNLYYFILEGEKDGIVVQDISSFIILEQNIPPLNSITSINDFSQRINLNQQIFVQLNYEGKNNLDNLFFSGAVLYQNDVKNTIKFFHNQVRFQTWNYFNDFLNEEENSYQIRFAVFDPQYIMPSLIIFSLKANLPPLNCLFKNFNNQQQEIFSLKQNYVFQINNCQDQDQPLYYNFFYYKSQEDFQYEILNPQFTKRYALNVKSTISRISTILPFGAKVIIGCVFDNLGAVRNMTQNVEIKNSYENVQQYVQLVQETYKIIIQIPFKQQIVIQL